VAGREKALAPREKAITEEEAHLAGLQSELEA